MAAKRKSMEPHLRDEVEFYLHQTTGIRKMARMRSFILADDMGLGKSLQAIVVFIIDVVMGKSQTMIVVCPATLIGNWEDEFKKFARITTLILKGTPQQRDTQLVEFMNQTGPRVLILNYEKVVGHLDRINEIGFDIACFDEAHYLKNPKSKRTQACIKLLSRRKFVLTGTPLLNRADELWTLMHLVLPTKYPKFYYFTQRYCVFGGYNDKQVVGTKNQRELEDNLNDIMIRRLKSEVLDLPEVQYIERRVDMTPDQRKLYEQAENDLELPDPDSLEPKAIESALTKFLRLKQICGTTACITPENDSSAKLDLAIEDDIEILKMDEKIVVFTQFRAVQAAYVDRLQDASKKEFGTTTPIWELNGDVKIEDRQKMIKEWSAQSGRAVIVCMLQVAKVGLNMTAAKHGSFLDEMFTPGDNQQAVDRLHRIGQSETHPVQIRKYITRGTIENRVQSILRTKKALISELIESDPTWRSKIVKAMMEKEEAT